MTTRKALRDPLTSAVSAIIRALYSLSEGSVDQATAIIDAVRMADIGAQFTAIDDKYKRNCVNCNRVYIVTRTNAPQLGFCPACDSDKYRTELRRVEAHNRRARRMGRAADLTFRQWRETLDHFGWMCAYCQKMPFTDLEHFVPLKRGGGTTKSNVVPACSRDNWAKRSRNPRKGAKNIRRIPGEDIERVRQYLDRFARGK